LRVLALSDPHLAEATPGKSMAVFGPPWEDHPRTLVERWRATVANEDIVIVAGDVSWARDLEAARPDLELLAALPGRKVLLRGNHDSWWSSLRKVRAALPRGLYAIHNDALLLDGVAIAGARLWDDPAIRLAELRQRAGTPPWAEPPPEEPERSERILARELGRLGISLGCVDPRARLRIAAVHYPPIGTDLAPSRTSAILEGASIQHCVFGHLHALAPRPSNPLFGERRGVRYHLTSCDYLDFEPLEIARLE
jgi:predicted phosphohydrolase